MALDSALRDDAPADAQALAASLAAAERGDAKATEALFAALYRELHRLARKQLRANAWGLTLGATTLLHEAYLDLRGRAVAFPDRARFFAYAARAMRGLIVDLPASARRKSAAGSSTSRRSTPALPSRWPPRPTMICSR